MFQNKKSQFLIFSALMLILMLLFIYYQETENTYIIKKGKFQLIENIQYETCQIGYLSNGSYIDQRYSSFETSVLNYCSGLGFNCTLQIVNNTQIPPLGDYSLLNYTHYDYSLYLDIGGLVYLKNFNC